MAHITADDVKAIRTELKAVFPKWKFSVRKESGNLSVAVTILRGTCSFDENFHELSDKICEIICTSDEVSLTCKRSDVCFIAIVFDLDTTFVSCIFSTFTSFCDTLLTEFINSCIDITPCFFEGFFTFCDRDTSCVSEFFDEFECDSCPS